MGFFSFLGRVLFASLFILSARQMFHDFGVDGGPAAKELLPKLSAFQRNISSLSGVSIPDIDVRHLVTFSLILKAVGGLLFVVGNMFGAVFLLLNLAILSPLLYDFYNYSPETPEYTTLLNDFLQHVALFGALLFFIGMKNLIPKRSLKKKAPKTKTT